MTQIKITVEGLNIYLEDGGATVPQMLRATFNLIKALDPYRPKGFLAVDDNDNIVVMAGEINAKAETADDKPAVLVVDMEDREWTGGDIQTHGQTYMQVIKAVEHLQRLYSQKMLAIAKALVGDNPKAQEKWMERVVNGGII